jgi:hypothetical protein
MPSIERNGPGSCAACRMTRTVAANRSQCAAPPRAAGVVGGIPRLAAQAASATATISTATAADPCRVAITMPAIVPRRIDVRFILGAEEAVVTLFLTLFSVGIAFGSLLCNRLLAGRLSASCVPWGALQLTRMFLRANAAAWVKVYSRIAALTAP